MDGAPDTRPSAVSPEAAQRCAVRTGCLALCVERLDSCADLAEWVGLAAWAGLDECVDLAERLGLAECADFAEWLDLDVRVRRDS